MLSHALRLTGSLAVLSLAASSAAGQVARLTNATPASRTTFFAPLVDATAFTGAETLVDFEDFPAGTALTNHYAALGLSFGLEDGDSPTIWRDLTTGRGGLGGELALTNAASSMRPVGLAQGSVRELGQAVSVHAPNPDNGALALSFGTVVNRVGFDLRSASGRPLNLLVTCTRNGVEIGTHFFDVATGFDFVGLHTTGMFDGLQLRTTNPSGEAFSLDNLRFELDVADADLDGVADFGDLCPTLFNPAQADSDGDGIGNACDAFPFDAQNDEDGDGLSALVDNCPMLYNPGQEDADGDGIGDGCDPLPLAVDSDGDGIDDTIDNCPMTPNPGQEDCDMDGIGDICDLDLVEPSVVNLALEEGDCVDIQKTICLPAVPPVVDVLITVDTTGSMGGEIILLRNEIIQFIQDLRALTGSNLRFALADYRDYPGFYSACGYAASYGTPGLDYAWRLIEPIGATDAEMLAAVTALSTGFGNDGPESYTRVLWEVTQPDAGIGWRTGAQRVVIDFQDAIPHDCNVSEGLVPACIAPNTTTGQDPGRDELLFTADDLDLQFDALLSVLNTNTKLFAIHSGTQSCVWQEFGDITQGIALQINANGTLPPGIDLAQEVFDTINDNTVFEVSFLVEDPDCALAYSFNPPTIGPVDVTNGAQVTMTETICIPPGTPPGDYTCVMTVLADGVATGFQTTNITVGDCRTLSFDTMGLVNGHAVTSGDFASLGLTIKGFGPNQGPAIFDSSPSGPNSWPDPDLLVGSGNLLILQQSPDQTTPGIFDDPDDAQMGGLITIDFDVPTEVLSIQLVDIDAPPPVQRVELTLVDGAGATRTYNVPSGWTTDIVEDGAPGYGTLDLTTLADQPGFTSTATATEDAGFDPLDVRSIEIDLASSGAIDNLIYCPAD